MAKTKVVIDNEGIAEFLRLNPGVRMMMEAEAEKVKTIAQATASSAEEGSGGRIDGYASAGFDIQWVSRGKRPRIDIISNADPETATAAHFHTQWRDGVAHMRAALYGITFRG